MIFNFYHSILLSNKKWAKVPQMLKKKITTTNYVLQSKKNSLDYALQQQKGVHKAKFRGTNFALQGISLVIKHTPS